MNVKLSLLISATIALFSVSATETQDLAQEEANQAGPDSTTTDFVDNNATSSGISTSATTLGTVKATPTSSRSTRIENQAKKVYSSAKSKLVNRGSYYLADYALSLKIYADMFAAKSLAPASGVGENATLSDQSGAQEAKMSDSEKAIVVDAVRSFLMPLSTYQTAQSAETPDKLASSLLGVIDVILEKAGSDQPAQKVTDGDWQPGQIWTSVVRRDHIDLVLKSRDTLFSLAPTKPSVKPDDLKAEDMKRLLKIRNYFSSQSSTSKRFTRLVHSKLNMDRFGERYVELIDKVLLKKPGLLKKCRVYLGKYLESGKSDEQMWGKLVKEAGGDVQRISGAAGYGLSKSMLTPFFPALLALFYVCL